MAAPLPCLPLSVPAAAVPDHAVRVTPFLAALICLLVLGGAHAGAQSTTVISGTVYDPRTTSDALPLPNVLVYATTGTPSALPSGVQCLTSTDSMPADPDIVSSTYTAVDGTYTLANVPVNTTVTLVIQAGKWRMQYPNTAVGSSPLTGLALHMPANHTQGDIPMIAISTGSVDALECVFRQMGIDDCEFTDDNGAVISGCNPGGHIHLYQGSDSPGAAMSASTPSQTELMSSATLMNGYDMLMFPCQGSSSNQSTLTGATNLFDFANSGGRVFATHYSYAWLDPDSPFDAQFPSVANWTIGSEQQITSGTGTLDTSFSDGAMMAQWLQNAGATITGSPDEIEIGTLRNDVSSVIAPSQSWVTLNSGTYAGQTGNPVMQMTFNTPVGSPAASQCGRVVYNDYHVFNASATGTVYPNECPAAAAMTPQEEMLEFALFDLSSFVTPVVVPTLSISFSPSPLVVNQGDTADQVTVDVTNTSASTEVYSSTVLTLALPPGLTATALADATGGWTCTVSTLTCAEYRLGRRRQRLGHPHGQRPRLWDRKRRHRPHHRDRLQPQLLEQCHCDGQCHLPAATDHHMADARVHRLWHRAERRATRCNLPRGRFVQLLAHRRDGPRHRPAHAHGYLHAHRYRGLHQRDGQRDPDRHPHHGHAWADLERQPSLHGQCGHLHGEHRHPGHCAHRHSHLLRQRNPDRNRLGKQRGRHLYHNRA